jgi:predicted O-methyltransferase YrrM
MAVLDNGLLAKLYRKLVHKFYINDLWLDLCIAAKKDSVAYIIEHMKDARILKDRFDVLRFAVSRAPAAGLILEFGVEKGASIRCIAEASGRTVHGFDSFAGLPADWRGTKEAKGKFDRQGKPPAVPANVELHVGWFDQTIGPFAAQHREDIALLHVDCDIYESTKIVFDQIGDRIVPGTVIVFDEYLNYPGWRQHEYKAFQEFVHGRHLRYSYIGLSAEKGHVAVRVE